MRRDLWLLLVVGVAGLLGASGVWADVTVIYRRADKIIAGVVHPPHSAQKEIENITHSELGGVPADYATQTLTDAQWAPHVGKAIAVDEARAVIFTPDPLVEAERALKNSALRKLKALGLTDQELNALLNK